MSNPGATGEAAKWIRDVVGFTRIGDVVNPHLVDGVARSDESGCRTRRHGLGQGDRRASYDEEGEPQVLSQSVRVVAIIPEGHRLGRLWLPPEQPSDDGTEELAR
jgi:hypothetical protein